MHLKVIQQMSRVPRSVGIPPLSDGPFEQALTVQAFNPPPMQMEDDGRINPLAGMGLTDEQYSLILQNLVNGQSFPGAGLSADVMGVSVADPGGGKRALDDDSDGRDGKRSRFEVLE
jgi:osomolarity two-component system, response regulator SKN7